MAIGTKNNNSGKNVFFVKVVTKDKDKKDVPPYFAFRQKQADGSYKEVQQDTSFDGNLVKVETGEFEYDGTVTPTLKARVEDGNDVYVLDTSFNFPSRGLINSLLSLENYENLRFNVYKTKPKAGETKSYPALSVWQNDTNVKWKYLKDEVPALKKIVLGKGKKDLTDSSELDEFFISKINEKFNGAKTPAKPSEDESTDSPL